MTAPMITSRQVAVDLRGRAPRDDGGAAIALVNMPYASAYRPSIQIGLLKSIAETHGHRASTFHFNVDFMQALHQISDDACEVYEYFAEERYAAGDWFFAGAAFGVDAPDPELVVEEWDREGRLESGWREAILRIYDEITPKYLDQLVLDAPWGEFDVVGFTSTFQQNVASFALARRLKESWPDLLNVFGGANFDGEMGREWVRSVPWIDYAIQSEADTSFPSFLDAIADGSDPVGIPGVIARREGEVIGSAPLPPDHLDSTPIPDYTEYFERIDRSRLVHRRDVIVPYESARGCWWGERRHCTFCGLNGETMAFRSKSGQRVLDELTRLALEHRVLRFNAVDNIIDQRYFEQLLPVLAELDRPFSLFYETKADLDRTRVGLLVASGVDVIQPGIESLSSRVLGLMRKGTRAVWNVNLLRWARWYDLKVLWNLIWGFPSETIDDIKKQTEACRALVHLQPPGSIGRVWMERFSPLFNEHERFPAAHIAPSANYTRVYPAHVDLDRAAYFFDYTLENTLPDDDYLELAEAWTRWYELEHDENQSATLEVTDARDHLLIEDRRAPGRPRTHELTGLRAELHRACMETWRTRKALVAEVDAEIDAVDDALHWLREHELVFVDDNLVLALALPSEPPPIRGRGESHWTRWK